VLAYLSFDDSAVNILDGRIHVICTQPCVGQPVLVDKERSHEFRGPSFGLVDRENEFHELGSPDFIYHPESETGAKAAYWKSA
jgi:hypothetical protein